MLKVAVPNKGVLSEATLSLLAEAGYATRPDNQQLHLVDERNQIEFFYLRPRDIATYVGSGSLDVGVTGFDLLSDVSSRAEEVADLGFGSAEFRLAADPDSGFQHIADLKGARVATSYPQILSTALKAGGVTAKIVQLDGAVENAIRLGVADAIADVVSTGNTIRRAGLKIFGPVLLNSSARLVTSPGFRSEQLDRLLLRLKGVAVARNWVLIDYDCPREILEQAIAITPGFEAPTLAPLSDENWVAVRALVRADDAHEKMDALFELGARAILVSEIHAARI
jgi:ATP phosphoribosyltransferase